jgi:hypothetical protein
MRPQRIDLTVLPAGLIVDAGRAVAGGGDQGDAMPGGVGGATRDYRAGQRGAGFDGLPFKPRFGRELWMGGIVTLFPTG